MDLACSQCGHRQERGDVCARCGSDTVHDLRSGRVRELLEEIDQRLAERREGRIRAAAVIGAMAIVVACWMVPGYWYARGIFYPGLPLFADQWLLMILVAFGLIKVLERGFRGQRFPYLAALPPADRP